MVGTTPSSRTGPTHLGHRRHRLPARPKATPATATTTPTTVRTDRFDATGKVSLRHGGRLYHLSIGRTYGRSRFLLLIQDLHIRVVNASTGELLRGLTIDPDRNYQPTGHPRSKRRSP